MNKNSQFKLIKYNKISILFEVFKEHYEEYDPGDMCFYGSTYTANCISD